MESTIAVLNFVLALGGVALLFGAAILLFDLYGKNRSLENLVTTYGLISAFLVTFCGSTLTLVYSEIFGFVPCGLCWFQRIFLYPQVVLLAVALYTKDKTVTKYGISLSVLGLIVSLYQHYLQMGGVELGACPTAAAGADCAERILFEFGFMTFPLASAAVFAFLITLYLYINKTK